MSFFHPQVPPLPDGDLREMMRAFEANQNARFEAFAAFLAAQKAPEGLPSPPQISVVEMVEPQQFGDPIWYALGLIMLGEFVIIGLLFR